MADALVPFRPLTEYDFLGEEGERGLILRHEFRRAYGYVLPTDEVVSRLVDFIHQAIGIDASVLDVGSGSGYLSKELCRRGIDCFAVEQCEFERKDKSFGYPIQRVYQRDALGGAVQFVQNGFDVVLMAWPPHAWDFALAIAKAMLTGQWLIYIGELRSGCCANDAFFDFLSDTATWKSHVELDCALNMVHVSLPLVHDQWVISERICNDDAS